MKKQNEIFLPKARKADLVTRQMPGELLVYDLKRHKVFCLNDMSARIWRWCNGKRTVAELTAELENHFQLPIDERIVWLALNQLEMFHLLQRVSGVSFSRQFSRRALMRAGLATAIALPIVTMIAAPTVAAAASAVTAQACGTFTPPCPGGPCINQGSKLCVLSPNKNICKCR
ncbi:MAG TPA: PqqD family protein [Pyrinomonadaceae bacterium]|nr:PqqD family protein [Pyrinomonadaceae bacterium]